MDFKSLNHGGISEILSRTRQASSSLSISSSTRDKLLLLLFLSGGNIVQVCFSHLFSSFLTSSFLNCSSFTIGFILFFCGFIWVSFDFFFFFFLWVLFYSILCNLYISVFICGFEMQITCLMKCLNLSMSCEEKAEDTMIFEALLLWFVLLGK